MNEEKMTLKKAVLKAFWEMDRDFNLYDDFFPRVKEIMREHGKGASEQGIGATMRKNCFYDVIDSKTGHYRKAV